MLNTNKNNIRYIQVLQKKDYVTCDQKLEMEYKQKLKQIDKHASARILSEIYFISILIYCLVLNSTVRFQVFNFKCVFLLFITNFINIFN